MLASHANGISQQQQYYQHAPRSIPAAVQVSRRRRLQELHGRPSLSLPWLLSQTGRGGEGHNRSCSEAGLSCKIVGHLLFEVVQILPVDLVHLLRVADDGVRVSLWVPRHCDAKVLTILVPAQMTTSCQ